MSAVPTILITIHQDEFGMPTTPTTEMTALSEKRVRGILHLLGWKGGFEEKREEYMPRWQDGIEATYRSLVVANYRGAYGGQ